MTDIWPITAGSSRVITIWTTVLAIPRQRRLCRLYKQYPLICDDGGCCLRRTWADDRLRYTQYPLKRGGCFSGHVYDTNRPRYAEDIVQKVPCLAQIWRPKRYRHQKWRNRALPSCKFSRRSARDICPLAKK